MESWQPHAACFSVHIRFRNVRVDIHWIFLFSYNTLKRGGNLCPWNKKQSCFPIVMINYPEKFQAYKLLYRIWKNLSAILLRKKRNRFLVHRHPEIRYIWQTIIKGAGVPEHVWIIIPMICTLQFVSWRAWYGEFVPNLVNTARYIMPFGYTSLIWIKFSISCSLIWVFCNFNK